MRAPSTLFVALLACLALAACGSSSDEAGGPTTESAETQPAGGDREQAPAIDGTTLEGDAISLGDFRGRPVLVNVWSSW